MRRRGEDRRDAGTAQPLGDGAGNDVDRGFGRRRDGRDDEPFDFFAAFGAETLRQRGVPAERLLRREASLIQRHAVDDAIAAVFLDNVASLQFRFFDGTDWIEDWDSDDRATYSRRLPRAVEIDLALYDDHGAVHHFATAVDVPLADARVRRRPSGSPQTSRTPTNGRTP